MEEETDSRGGRDRNKVSGKKKRGGRRLTPKQRTKFKVSVSVHTHTHTRAQKKKCS